ncbi:MAG: hypothetical protein M0R21_03655 [Lentimicrobiaceae bacterium]|nr:hypothetical protein [Lentimicrobiaceae bacterium]
MKKIFFFLFSCIFIGTLHTQDVQSRMKKKWETPAVFKTPESVCYDIKRGVYYVSNVNGSPSKEDKNGFISKLSLDGKVIKLKWIKKLNAPKGMGIYKDKLYVADIKRVVEIDLEKGSISKIFPIENAVFLNDILIDRTGNIFISDTQADKIFMLKDGKAKIWLASADIKKPNGMCFNNNEMLIGCENTIVRVNAKTKKVHPFAEKTGTIDGITSGEKGFVLVSDFNGKISAVYPPKVVIKLLDTSKEKLNTTDIFYVQEKKLLLVPTFKGNRVIAYEVVF